MRYTTDTRLWIRDAAAKIAFNKHPIKIPAVRSQSANCPQRIFDAGPIDIGQLATAPSLLNRELMKEPENACP